MKYLENLTPKDYKRSNMKSLSGRTSIILHKLKIPKDINEYFSFFKAVLNIWSKGN